MQIYSEKVFIKIQIITQKLCVCVIFVWCSSPVVRFKYFFVISDRGMFQIRTGRSAEELIGCLVFPRALHTGARTGARCSVLT